MLLNIVWKKYNAVILCKNNHIAPLAYLVCTKKKRSSVKIIMLLKLKQLYMFARKFADVNIVKKYILCIQCHNFE